MYVCAECGGTQPLGGACQACGGTTASNAEDALLGAGVGPYRIARLLGVGGMGRVYKGVQPQIGSRVAIKVLSRECTDRKDLVDRFFSEARAVNLIRHENIVNVLDLSMLPDGRPYIVMEFLDGAPLAELVGRLGPMPLGGAARLAVEVLDALAAAHAKGIVHRDLKPDNVFITPAGRAKVLDFGIAKLLPELGGSFTQTGSLLGTPHYMSPEQAAGKQVDARTDLYAMGVILFECATGHKPFYGDSMFDLLRKHVEMPPPSPRQLRPDLPPAYEAVILTALAKDPAQRFASAGAMTAALQHAAQGLPPEQWALITGAGSGVVPATPSGAGFRTPASWGGVARAVPEGSAPAPLPQPPAYAAGAPPFAAPPLAGYPPQLLSATTATAGQVVPPTGRGGSKVVLGVLGALVVVGVAVAAVVASREPAGSGSAVAAGSNSGQPAVPPAGASGSAAAPPSSPVSVGSGSGTPVAAKPAEEGSDSAEGSAEEGPAEDTADTAGSGSAAKVPAAGGAKLEDLPEYRDLISRLPPQYRNQVREQLRAVDRQLASLPPAQRELVMRQVRASLAMSSGQLQQAQDDPEPPAEAPEPGPAEAPEPEPAPEPEAPLPKGWNGKQFNMDTYLPTALAAARRVAPDAQLFRIDAEGVLPSGLVDLSMGSVRYGFISKARAQRPKNVPLGAKWSPNCQVNVWVEASGIDVREFVGCKETAVPMPRCSLKQRWQAAIAKGAPKSNAIAEIGYRAGVIDGKPKWFFDIDDAFDDGPAADDCR